MTTSTDRIETQVQLQAPPERVWHAIADAESFGAWFGVDLRGQHFTAGARCRGQTTHPGYEHVVWDAVIDTIDAPHRLAFRWHPYAIDNNVDYSAEPTTLVTFSLSPSGDGTLLSVVETGFDALPPERRALAFRMHDDGWRQQISNVTRYLEAHVAGA